MLKIPEYPDNRSMLENLDSVWKMAAAGDGAQAVIARCGRYIYQLEQHIVAQTRQIAELEE
jgi:hypothetical protein